MFIFLCRLSSTCDTPPSRRRISFKDSFSPQLPCLSRFIERTCCFLTCFDWPRLSQLPQICSPFHISQAIPEVCRFSAEIYSIYAINCLFIIWFLCAKPDLRGAFLLLSTNYSKLTHNFLACRDSQRALSFWGRDWKGFFPIFRIYCN